MISTVLCGRFYKIFVSPMLHFQSFFMKQSYVHPEIEVLSLDTKSAMLTVVSGNINEVPWEY